MKLLLCLSCDDIFNLYYDEKSCRCGETKGKYNDIRNAVYSGKHAVPLAIDNLTLAEAIRNQPKEGLGSHFTAIVIPKKCPTFVKKTQKRRRRGRKMNKKVWKESETLNELFHIYKSMANSEYALSQELEKKKWDEELIEAFITYIRWNILPSARIPDWKYEESKETLERFGYMTSIA